MRKQTGKQSGDIGSNLSHAEKTNKTTAYLNLASRNRTRAFYIPINNLLLSSGALPCVDVLQTVFFKINTTMTLLVNKNILPSPFCTHQARTAAISVSGLHWVKNVKPRFCYLLPFPLGKIWYSVDSHWHMLAHEAKMDTFNMIYARCMCEYGTSLYYPVMCHTMPVVDQNGAPGWRSWDCAAESVDGFTNIQSASPRNNKLLEYAHHTDSSGGVQVIPGQWY